MQAPPRGSSANHPDAETAIPPEMPPPTGTGAAPEPARAPASAALAKLLLYLLAVMLAAALLAPALFHLGESAGAWLPNSPLAGTRFATWLGTEIGRAHLPRYFNRAVLICALLLLWPLLRWLRIPAGIIPTWRPWQSGLRESAIGFTAAAGILLLLGGTFTALGAYRLRPDAHWAALGEPLRAALAVGFIEEIFFRGFLLGLLLASMRRLPALVACSFIFAIVHFLKPPESWHLPDDQVTWTSGFLALGKIAEGFGSVQFLLAEFATLFAVGWVLARARVVTGRLWLPVGLHAGWVFGLKYFSALTWHQPGWLPWIGANLKIGLCPLAAVLLTGWLALKTRRPPPP